MTDTQQSNDGKGRPATYWPVADCAANGKPHWGIGGDGAPRILARCSEDDAALIAAALNLHSLPALNLSRLLAEALDLNRKQKRPVCPDCRSGMAKAFIECEDGSGWQGGWLCDCEFVQARAERAISATGGCRQH